MEKDLKLALAKLLGEILETNSESTIDQGTIYGLKNGFEFVINDFFSEEYSLTQEDYENFVSILNPIWNDLEKLENFSGFYEIESSLKDLGINKDKAWSFFKYFQLKGTFGEIREKLDSSNSPTEFRNFKDNNEY